MITASEIITALVAALAEGRKSALTDAIRLVEKAKRLTVTEGGIDEPDYQSETEYIDGADLLWALTALRDAP